jgi:protein gp37
MLRRLGWSIVACLPKDWGDGYANVWLGCTVGCRMRLPSIDALRRIPIHPKAVRFLSCEPLLENISNDIDLTGIGWIIAGGESGDGEEYLWNPEARWQDELKLTSGRRTMKLEWAYGLWLRAIEAKIPFFFKQITSTRSGQGEDALGCVVQEFPAPPFSAWAPTPEDLAAQNPLVVL